MTGKRPLLIIVPAAAALYAATMSALAALSYPLWRAMLAPSWAALAVFAGLVFTLALVLGGRETGAVENTRRDAFDQDLKKAYGELEETRAYLQMILDNSRVLIITTDNAGRIVEFNREAEKHLGYSRDEVVGKDVLMLYDRPAERPGTFGGASTEVWEARDREVTLKSKTGEVSTVQITLSTMVDREGRIKGTVGVGKDVSEQKMLRFKLLHSEKLAGIGTLASGIAHEINNPLAGILGMAEAIKDEDDMELVRSHTDDIIRYALGASDIVRELSAYSRSARSEGTQPVDLVIVLENSIKMARHSASFASVELTSDLRENCLVMANPGEMQQIFVNLIINAIQAMDGGGRLTVKCALEGSFVVATITDTGSGIPAAEVGRIYDPFFTTKPVGKGTGLGLFVVYRLVTMYGGSIDVDSRPGSGTVFTLRFPSSASQDSDISEAV